ncbi:hypothetical protein [Amycolatopsis australiensis]|uniref:Excreted virulence factor EspC, type VII ESX diderm n=1 Tax=Amycolatopsis australiensis TaxID=546364 RepID=A0A1K1SK57_9PSEU|nr:hypothetical protein [Amycolatopsis australiensis]SFW84463.1 hypothetical protein SAMN04489730_5875 [Amycolatopsis australiensis]
MATVRDEADARRQLHAEQRREKAERREPRERASGVAKPQGAGAAALIADGSDVLALDYAEIDDAKKALDAHYEELAGHLRTARDLNVPLADGKGPVSHWMRRSFGLRGGAEAGGVQAALESYLAELASLRQALDVVAATHRRNDEEAAEALRVGEPDA